MNIRQLTATLFSILLMTIGANAQTAGLTFTKSFSPATVGPGSTSMLTFTITNPGAPVTSLAFTDVLPVVPGSLTVADNSGSFTCPSGTLTAIQGAGSISFSGGTLGAGASCTISVKVRASSTTGVHSNVTGNLTSSAGSAGTASADLTVDGTLPGFSAAFNNPFPSLNQTVTLTYTIDNSANASNVSNLDFSATMPPGIPFASPNNATTNCGTAIIPPTLTVAGNAITLDSNGTLAFPAVAAGATCTVSVDVLAAAAGQSTFISGPLLADFVSAGTSSATLDVSGPAGGEVFISKQFMNDPIGPGGTAQLQFTLINNNLARATGLTFTDNFNAMLAGATSTGTPPTDPCGTGSSVTLGSTLTLTNGAIPARGSCSFTVDVTVPAAPSSVGIHSNSTSPVSGSLDGSPFTGESGGSDDLEVVAGTPLGFEKLFVGGAVNAGDDIQLRFTIRNPNTGASLGATDITFVDELTDPSGFPGGGPTGAGFLPFPVSVALPPVPNPPCGTGSSLALISVDTDRQGLELTGGNLGPAETECSFEVTVTIPGDLPGGTYTNTTGTLSATISGTTVTTAGASGSVTVNGGLNLRIAKSFANAVAPGATVDLTFEITNEPDSVDAESIAFSDDLAALTPALAGVTAGAPTTNTCGGTMTGTSNLSYSGGSLTANSSCTIVVPVTVPAAAPFGTYGNTTSNLTATTIGGSVVTPFPGASADLVVTGLIFTKEFRSDPVIAGDTVALRFSIQNLDTTTDASITFFTDNVAADLTAATVSAATTNTCGSTVSGAGTGFLIVTGGTVSAGTTCEIEVAVLVPAATADNIYSNITSALSTSFGTTPPATDTLTVQSALISLSKEFTDDPVAPGDPVTLEFTLENQNTGAAASSIFFDDNLGAMLAGTTYDSLLFNDCGATVSGTATDTINVTGAALAAGGSCTIRVSLTVPGGAAGGGYNNTTTGASGEISGFAVTGDPASDTLDVSTVGSTFSKAFDGPTLPGGTATLTFTITNPNPATLTSLGFTDDLDAVISGLVATSLPSEPCGVGSSITGTGYLTFTGGELAPSGGTCSFDVEVTVPGGAAGGTYGNTTSNLTSAGLFSASPATADLTVIPTADISVTKSDGVTTATPGGSLTYTIAVSNAGPSTDPSVGLADTFPAGLTCTYTSVAAGGATGNTAAGAGNLAETLSMPAGSSVTYTASCGIDGAATGTLLNTATATASVTDPVPGNNSATDGDTVLVPEADLSVTKTDGVTSVIAGQSVTYTIIAANDGPSADPAASVADTFPAELTGCNYTAVATGGATGFTAAGSGDIADTAVSMPASSTLTYTATCTVDPATPTTTLSNTATIAASVTDPAPGNNSATDGNTSVLPTDLMFSKLFAPDSVELGQTTLLTFTINNDANAIAATGLAFTDNLAPFGLVLTSTPPVNGCSGALTAANGTSLVALAGGTTPAGTTCEITVELRADLAGSHDNVTTDLVSNLPTQPGATDRITVSPAQSPTLTKVLSSTDVQEGEAITMTLEIVNPNSFLAAQSVVLTDDMTGTLRVTSDATGTAACDGTVTGSVGDEAVGFTGTVDPGETCTITVGLLVIADAGFTNTAAMTSSLGDATAEVAVAVTPAPPLTFSMSFTPGVVEVTESSTLTYTIENTSLVKATSISIADTLPANLIIARPVTRSKTCVGGMVGATEGGSDISYDGGELDPLSVCTVSVDVVSGVAAQYPNSTETQTSSLGDSAPANDTLTVEAANNGNIVIEQRTDTDGAYVFSSATPALNFTINASGGIGSAGPFELPVGTYVINQSPPEGVGNTAITCDDGDSTGDPLARTITVNLSGLETVTCTITSISTLQKTVDTINRFLTKRADLILSSEPRPGRRFDRLNRGFGNASRFTWSPGDLKAFLPFSAEFAPGSRDYRFSTSMLQVRQAAASVALAHGSTKDAMYVDNYRFDAWFEAQFKKFDTGAQGEGHFAIAYFGADYLVTPDMLVGVLLQVDDMQDLSASLNTSARGTGWMVGPYMTARLAPNLYFDGRIAAGRSDNEVSPFNTYTDDFKTDRWLAMASITGDFQRGPWNIKPTASLSYFEESQDAYVDGLGATIPSQTVRLGQLKIGPTFTGKFETENGMLLAPYFGIDAIYNIGETTGVTISNPATPATEGWRGRLQAGLNVTMDSGTNISFGASYDGLFRDDFDSWGVMFDVTIPLSKPTAR